MPPPKTTDSDCFKFEMPFVVSDKSLHSNKQLSGKPKNIDVEIFEKDHKEETDYYETEYSVRIRRKYSKPTPSTQNDLTSESLFTNIEDVLVGENEFQKHHRNTNKGTFSAPKNTSKYSKNAWS